MPSKEKLIEKLLRTPSPKNFSVRELDQLMSKCDCTKFPGGRGSGIGYYHNETNRVLQFDRPHPGNDLYNYHIKKTKEFLKAIGEIQ